MSDETSPKSNHTRTWIERLSYSLLREPKDREQLLELLRDAANRQVIDKDDLDMIEGVRSF